MKEEPTPPEPINPNEWKTNLSLGVMWLLILLGIGGCMRLAYSESDKPIISITTDSK